MVEANALKAIKADQSDFDTVCCATKPLCSSYTCLAGRKAKAGAATISCAGNNKNGVCTATECCDLDTTKCLGAVAGATGAAKYCVAATHVFDVTKAGTAVKADYTDFIANCCILRTNCDAFNKTFMTVAQVNKNKGSGAASGSVQQTPTVFLLTLAGILALF